MSALRESRFRGTAQLNVPDGAAGDAASPKHFLPRPEPAQSPTEAATSTSPPPAASASALASVEPHAAPAADPDGAVEAVDATLAVFDNSITSRGFFAARSQPARVTCEGGELRWESTDESGALRLDASSFRLVRGGASPTSFAGSLQTPQRHAAGAREWRFAHLELDAKVSITPKRGRAISKRRAVGLARDAVVIFKADGKRSAIRELRLPPGMRATVARGAPPAPPPAPAEAPPEAPPSPEEPKKRWFERARKVSIR